jgi:hypothetical protein
MALRLARRARTRQHPCWETFGLASGSVRRGVIMLLAAVEVGCLIGAVGFMALATRIINRGWR